MSSTLPLSEKPAIHRFRLVPESASRVESTSLGPKAVKLSPSAKARVREGHDGLEVQTELPAAEGASAHMSEDARADVRQEQVLATATVDTATASVALDTILTEHPATASPSAAPVAVHSPVLAAAPAENPVLAGWADAMMSIDQIPTLGMLAAGTVVALAPGGGGGAPTVPAAVVDTTPPRFVSATTSTDGTKLMMTYDGVLAQGVAAKEAFTVVVGGTGTAREVSAVAVNGSTVELTLASPVVAGQAVTVAYTDPTTGNDVNAVQDAAGNDAATLTNTTVTNAVPADASAPTVSVQANTASLASGQVANLTFTLSEASTDFAQADIAVSGGTLSNFSGSGTVYTATFTPNPNTSATGRISVASAKFSDAAGNQNADGADTNNAVSFAIDTAAPVAPMALLDGDWTVNPQVTMRIALDSGNPQDVVVELYPNAAPLTVTNWLAYVNADFYSGLIFHRVTRQATSGFSIIQGGGYDGDLNPKAALYDPVVLETGVTAPSNVTGTIAMARTSVADSATSQFYINASNNTFFDYASTSNPGYAVFGSVISGMSTVNVIDAVATSTVNGMANVPTSDITLTDVSVTAYGQAWSHTGIIYLGALESGAQWSYSLDTGNQWTTLAQDSIDLSGTGAGQKTVSVRQIDGAGNASAITTLQFTLYAPDARQSILDLATASDTVTGSAGTSTDNITSATSLSLSALLNAATWANHEVWLMDNGAKVATATVDQSGALAWTAIGASAGDHIFTLYDPQHHVRILEGGSIAASELLVRVI